MKRFSLISLFVGLIVISLAIGSENLTFDSVGQLSTHSQMILYYSRIPRTISILLAGSSMSVAGLLMQSISQNRFASPSTIGTIEASKLGLLLSLWLIPNVTLSQKLLFSFMSAMLMTILFLLIVQQIRLRHVWTLPLFGIIYGQVINAVASGIAYQFDLVQSISSWQQGSFALVQNGSYEWLWLSLIIILLIFMLNRPLTIMQLGKDTAVSLGIPYEIMRYLVIACVSMICAVNVMTVGVLSFIGVIIPNLVRLVASDTLAKSLPIVALVGSMFVLICDIIARSLIKPYEIPVNVIISVIGGIVFLTIILRKEWQIR